MKKILVAGLVGASLAILVVGFAIPAFAHVPGVGETAPADRGEWEAMYEACISGTWDEMAEAMEEFHNQYAASMPCYNYGYGAPDEGAQEAAPGWGSGGGHMGGGMMGGSGGMMGW